MNYPTPPYEDKWTAVKRIAHYMCEEAGLDPLRIVDTPRYRTYTTWNYLNNSTDDWLNTPIKTTQWEAFIRDAAIAYIGWKAVQRYMLVDA